jgi:hypothetical protein
MAEGTSNRNAKVYSGALIIGTLLSLAGVGIWIAEIYLARESGESFVDAFLPGLLPLILCGAGSGLYGWGVKRMVQGRKLP